MRHRLADFKEEFNLVVEVVFDALCVGAMCAPSELASRWPCFAGPLCKLLKRLEAASSYAGLARRLQYSLERRILYATDMRATTVLGLTAVASIDVRRPAALPLPATVDRLLVTIHAGEKWLGMTEMPVFTSMSSREIAKIALQTIGLRIFVQESAALRQPRTWVAGALTMAHGFMRRVRKPDGAGMRPLAREALQSAALAIAGPSSAANTSNQILERIIATARREGEAGGGYIPRPGSTRPASKMVHADRRNYWEAMFVTVDPWNYGSDYEQVKYERTLGLVPARTGRALELACAEGHFTAQLARRVDQLTAADISQTALDRAQARCASVSNIAFKRLDLAADPLPKGFDLIVCSEVLYFLSGRDELVSVCSRLKDSLAPGGRLLSAHAFVLKDDQSRTAFDWEGPYGAAVISDTMSRTPELALEASIETELYRIDLFRRFPPDERPAPPRIERVPLGAALEPKVARQVVWGGASIRRADVQRNERTERLPILAYHRIADDGPPALARYRTRPEMFRAQMRWLRSEGYHTVSAVELVQRLIHRERFPGRPVMITFDDGTEDFYDTAWPILRNCDFSAEVFIVTDLVGHKAIWDAEYGQPAPLMGADKIKDLVQEGVRFGSHLATHRAADGLASAELAAELARSRSILETWTGAPVTEFAAPYGISDDRLVNLVRHCGYSTIFTSHLGVAQLGDDPYRLPRIGVHGDWGLDRFVEYLESAR
jgi:peptidoglycan/xylan/chitin deacetylase (PgdA/CDA1 family)